MKIILIGIKILMIRTNIYRVVTIRTTKCWCLLCIVPFNILNNTLKYYLHSSHEIVDVKELSKVIWIGKEYRTKYPGLSEKALCCYTWCLCKTKQNKTKQKMKKNKKQSKTKQPIWQMNWKICPACWEN